MRPVTAIEKKRGSEDKPEGLVFVPILPADCCRPGLPQGHSSQIAPFAGERSQVAPSDCRFKTDDTFSHKVNYSTPKKVMDLRCPCIMVDIVCPARLRRSGRKKGKKA